MPSHVDLSVLWVPIMPETSKLGPAMEEAGKGATESFDKGTSGLGDKIHDSFTKATGKVKDVFHKSGNDASEAMADGVKQNSKKVEDALEDTGKKAGGKFSDAVENVLPDSLSKGGSKLNGLAEKLGTEIGARLGSGIGDQLEKLDGYAKTVGIDISGWTGPIKDAAGPFSDLKADGAKFASQITDVSSTFEGMPGKVGKLASAISELAVPIGILEQGLEKVNDLLDKAGGKHKWDDVVNPSDPNAGQGFWDKVGRLFQSWTPGGTFDNGPAPGAPPKGGYWWAPGGASPGNLAPLFPGMPAAASPPPGGGVHPAGVPQGGLPDVRGAHQDLAYIFSSIQQQFPWVKLTAGKDDHPVDQGWHPRGQALDLGGGSPAQQAQLSNWLTQFAPYIEELIHQGPGDTQNVKSGKLGPAIDMPGSVYNTGQAGYHGDHVHLAVTDQQGQALYSAMTGGGALPPGALASGGSSASPSAAISSRGSGSLGSSSSSGGLGSAPTGAQHDPLYIMPADSSGGSGGSGSQDQAQQLGSGFLDGLAQSVGLDGSVFKGFGGSSNPLHFGVTKLATGLLNTLGGGQQGGGGGGSMIPGLGSLIPHAGSVPVGPGGAQNVRTGETQNVTNHYYDNVGPQLNVTQNGQGSPTQDLHETLNGAGNRMPAYTAPNGGGGPTPP